MVQESNLQYNHISFNNTNLIIYENEATDYVSVFINNDSSATRLHDTHGKTMAEQSSEGGQWFLWLPNNLVHEK